ncbi:MAG: hypothetical protein GX493_00710 [Firmicutes bacterium]|nr:hypothetical protein [Bacillota bacterium]
MNEEKLRVLQMIQEGKISATEGLELLEALEEPQAETGGPAPAGKARFFRVRVYGEGEKVPKVNVNIPLGLIKAVSKFANLGMAFIPEEARRKMEDKGIDLSQLDLAELLAQSDQGLAEEKLVDVDIDDPEEGKMRVEVYVE